MEGSAGNGKPTLIFSLVETTKSERIYENMLLKWLTLHQNNKPPYNFGELSCIFTLYCLKMMFIHFIISTKANSSSNFNLIHICYTFHHTSVTSIKTLYFVPSKALVTNFYFVSSPTANIRCPRCWVNIIS